MNKIQETARACLVHILVVKNTVFVYCIFKFSKQSPGATAIKIQFTCLIPANIGPSFLSRHGQSPALLADSTPRERRWFESRPRQHSSQRLLEKSTDGSLRSLSTLTGQTRSRRATHTCRERHSGQEPRQARLCQTREVKRPRPRVFGRLNKSGPETTRWGHLSPSYAKENSSLRREEGTLGHTQEQCSIAWPCQGCDCSTPEALGCSVTLMAPLSLKPYPVHYWGSEVGRGD